MGEKAFVRRSAPAAARLKVQFAKSQRLEKAIRANLEGLGYDG
jgi:hypothetical protein